MTIVTPAGAPDRNCLIESLTGTGALRTSRPEEVCLDAGQVLIESGTSNNHVYFVHEGLISLMTMLEDGREVQTGLVGREGVIGHPYLADFDASPAYAAASVPGTATRLPAEDLFTAIQESSDARDTLGCFARAFLTQTLQTVACNAVHSAQQRLAKWLLLCVDRVDNGIPLSQEFIAQMLGVSRPTVTLVLGKMQEAGIVEQQRRQIAVRDRSALEVLSCPCYWTIRNAYEKLLPLTYR